MKKTTQVYLVCDLSGSMAGDLERTLRSMVTDTIATLKAVEAQGDQVFEVTFIPFSTIARPGAMYVASAVSAETIASLHTRAPGMGGGTALRDAIGKALELGSTHRDIPMLVNVFTDGVENASAFYGDARLGASIAAAEKQGNVTVTMAGPATAIQHLRRIGLPEGNFRPWDGSLQELRAVSDDHVKAITQYTMDRGAGVTRSGRFYADASQVTPAGVKANTKLVVPTDIRTVPQAWAGRTIADFYGHGFDQGHHFYQLVKPEYILDDKDLVVYIKSQKEYRLGARSVRALLKLPETGKLRVHPSTTESDFVIFVRSDSNNRKLVEGQQLLTI